MIVKTRTLIIYILILSIFSIFTNSIIDDKPTTTIEDSQSMFSIKGVILDISDLFSGEGNFFYKSASAISILWRLPIAILVVISALLSLPFLGFPHLPPIVGLFIYLPYTLILFFDVFVPLIIKFFEILGDYIPFT